MGFPFAGNSKKVRRYAAYHEITAWAVEEDTFKVKLLGKKDKLKERAFLTGIPLHIPLPLLRPVWRVRHLS